MSVDVTTQIVIARPRAIVSAYAANPEHTPVWSTHIVSSRWLTKPPLKVGSRLSFIAHILGRHLVYTYEVTDYVPGDYLTMQSSNGPFAMTTTYAWQDTDEGYTLMTLNNLGAPGRFFRMLTPLLLPAMRRINRHDLLRLKAILESLV